MAGPGEGIREAWEKVKGGIPGEFQGEIEHLSPARMQDTLEKRLMFAPVSRKQRDENYYRMMKFNMYNLMLKCGFNPINGREEPGLREEFMKGVKPDQEKISELGAKGIIGFLPDRELTYDPDKYLPVLNELIPDKLIRKSDYRKLLASYIKEWANHFRNMESQK